VDTFAKLADVPGYAKMVPRETIADDKNNFNLNLPRYIESTEAEDIHDLEGHLLGGVPDRDLDPLTPYWRVLPSVRATLFGSAGRPGYSQLRLPLAEVREAILSHHEFDAYNTSAKARFTKWQATAASTLTGFDCGSHPKELIAGISESLLDAFRGESLIDPYAVYQHLMDYWAATMQDDCYAIAAEGWVARPTRIVTTDKKGKRKDKGWSCDLVPKALLVARCFPREQAALDAKEAELAETTATLAELEEEHGGEDGVLGSLDAIATAEVKARVKEIAGDSDADEERGVLRRWLTLAEREGVLRREVREQDAALDLLAFRKYDELSSADVKTLVVEDKWMASVATALGEEVAAVSTRLSHRLEDLGSRYAVPLSRVARDCYRAEESLRAVLRAMGIGA
jgi:type I restriction enzyme M protein